MSCFAIFSSSSGSSARAGIAAGATAHQLVRVHGDDPGAVLLGPAPARNRGQLSASSEPSVAQTIVLNMGVRPFLRCTEDRPELVSPHPCEGAGGVRTSPADSLSRVHRLTKKQARRIAVRAQLLDAPRPKGLLAVVERLTLLQVDPTAAIAPNADLVAWSRLGSAYRPEQLTRALEQERTLFEFNALIRPMGDLGLYLAGSGGRRGQSRVDVWLRDNDRCRRDILRLLKRSGPLDFPRHPGHVRRAVGVERLDERPQRHPDARVHAGAGPGGDLRPRRAGAAVGPARARLSGRRRDPAGRGGGAEQERAAARGARHRAGAGRGRCRWSRSTSARRASPPSSRA